jgi:eukaryotic-like serine/threonine-protein kinase
MLVSVDSTGETIERAIVFEEAFGYRRLSAQRCVIQWLSQFAESLLQVDVGLREVGTVLFVVFRFRQDRFGEADDALITGAGEHAGGRVLALSELEYQERGNFLNRFNECTHQRLGISPKQVGGVLLEFFKRAGERRAAVRHPVEAPGLVTVDGKTEKAAVADLSSGGALIKTANPPGVKAKVELEVTLPSGPVRAPATVVNVSKRGVSLQFTPAAAPVLTEKLAALEPTKLDTQLTVAALVAPPTTFERVGPYELRTLLGTGGTADVHLAAVLEGPRKGQNVAIKRLHKRRAQDPEAVRRFEFEAKTLGLLQHQNIVRAFEVSVLDGQQHLVMELIDGHDLGHILRKARAKKKQLPVDVACFAVKVLLDALHAVHSAKDAAGEPLELVHCDVSPHNLFVAKTGAIKLGDFGLSRRSGTVLTHIVKQGRPTYLSPELLDGQVSQSADLWAAGVSLYELLTFEQPFAGNTIDELTAAIRQKREVPLMERRRECSGPLEAVLKSALEKDPSRRFKSAKEFSDAVAPHFHPVRAPQQLAALMKELFR